MGFPALRGRKAKSQMSGEFGVMGDGGAERDSVGDEDSEGGVEGVSKSGGSGTREGRVRGIDT